MRMPISVFNDKLNRMFIVLIVLLISVMVLYCSTSNATVLFTNLDTGKYDVVIKTDFEKGIQIKKNILYMKEVQFESSDKEQYYGDAELKIASKCKYLSFQDDRWYKIPREEGVGTVNVGLLVAFKINGTGKVCKIWVAP